MEHHHDSETYRPAWMRIADDLASAMNEGEYAAESVLPGAYALADYYGVNRHTVRQALLHLQDAGFVKVRRGQGATVLTRRIACPLGQKVSVRSILNASGLAVSRHILDHQCVPASEQVAQILKIEVRQEVFIIRTLDKAGGVPISHSVHVVDTVQFPDFVDCLEEAGASFAQAFKACGVEDYSRISTRISADVASEKDAKVLEIKPGAPILRSRVIEGLDANTPLQAVNSVFAGGRVEMIIEGEKPLF